MVSRLAVGLALVALCCGACGSAPAAQPAQTAGNVGQGINVTGTLDRGPAAPTCPAGEPCDPPAVATMLVFSRPGSADVSVHVAGDGSFALHLDPGEYSIAIAPPAFQGKVEPSTVRVPDVGEVLLRLRIVRST